MIFYNISQCIIQFWGVAYRFYSVWPRLNIIRHCFDFDRSVYISVIKAFSNQYMPKIRIPSLYASIPHLMHFSAECILLIICFRIRLCEPNTTFINYIPPTQTINSSEGEKFITMNSLHRISNIHKHDNIKFSSFVLFIASYTSTYF